LHAATQRSTSMGCGVIIETPPLQFGDRKWGKRIGLGDYCAPIVRNPFGIL
jgi:hypothetical protein